MSKDTKLRISKKIICLALITFLIGFLLLVIVSCEISSVYGSGNIISEDRNVSEFSKVSISGSGNLFIEQGNEESLTIEAEDNILPLITNRVYGNTLTIGFKLMTNVTTTKNIEFHLKVRDIDSISATGSGNINCLGFSTNNLSIKTTGSGNVDISNLITTNININSTGSGNYNLAGETDNLNLSFSGSGDCNAGELTSKKCKIKATGSGDFIVNVSNDLNVSINGSGGVSYIGNPTVDSSIGLGASGKIKNISE